MRILRIITRLNAGGPSRHVVWANAGLAKRGHDVLLAAGRVEANEDDLSSFADRHNVEVRWIDGLRRAPGPAGDLGALRDLRSLVRSFRPDVVHTHTAKAGALGRLAVLGTGPGPTGRTKVFHTFHGHTFHGYFRPPVAFAFRAVESALGRWATDRIVTLSPAQRDEITRLLGIPASRFVVVPNALDLSDYAVLPPRGAFRASIGVAPAAPLWGAVGRIAPIKNYPLLFDVARILRGLHGEAAPVLAVVGGGDELGTFRERVVREGLDGRIVFAGPRYDLPQVYADLDGLVSTSNNEGTPLSMIEAMTCGLPIVATGVGGVPDLLGSTFEGPVDARRFVPWSPPRGTLVAKGDAGALAREIAVPRPRRLPDGTASPFRLERLLDDLERLYSL